MAIPSARTIALRLCVSTECAAAVRRLMEAHERSGARFVTDTMEAISATLPGGHNAEYIPPGRGRASPSIEYANRGDTYAPTILYLDGVTADGRATGRGRWAVGAWGDIVERGNYQ